MIWPVSGVHSLNQSEIINSAMLMEERKRGRFGSKYEGIGHPWERKSSAAARETISWHYVNKDHARKNGRCYSDKNYHSQVKTIHKTLRKKAHSIAGLVELYHGNKYNSIAFEFTLYSLPNSLVFWLQWKQSAFLQPVQILKTGILGH